MYINKRAYCHLDEKLYMNLYVLLVHDKWEGEHSSLKPFCQYMLICYI